MRVHVYYRTQHCCEMLLDMISNSDTSLCIILLTQCNLIRLMFQGLFRLVFMEFSCFCDCCSYLSMFHLHSKSEKSRN